MEGLLSEFVSMATLEHILGFAYVIQEKPNTQYVPISAYVILYENPVVEKISDIPANLGLAASSASGGRHAELENIELVHVRLESCVLSFITLYLIGKLPGIALQCDLHRTIEACDTIGGPTWRFRRVSYPKDMYVKVCGTREWASIRVLEGTCT
jgi:hypothetical protein